MRSVDLIDSLAADLKRVVPLPPPPRRLAFWLFASLLYIGAIVLAAGPRLDLFEKAQEPRFLVEVSAAIATGVLSAVAAFHSISPGRSVWYSIAPLPALAVWLGSLGQGCWHAWLVAGSEGLTLAPDMFCFPAIVAASVVPTVLIVAMMRRGSSVMPALTMALAVLAATSLGAAALRLFHVQDASVMLLVWQFGTVALLTSAAAIFGDPLLPRLEARAAAIRSGLSGHRHTDL